MSTMAYSSGGFTDTIVDLGYGYTARLTGGDTINYYNGIVGKLVVSSLLHEYKVTDKRIVATQWDRKTLKLVFWVIKMDTHENFTFKDLKEFREFCNNNNIDSSGFPTRSLKTPQWVKWEIKDRVDHN